MSLAVIDVYERNFRIDCQNKKADDIEKLMQIVNWAEVNHRCRVL